MKVLGTLVFGALALAAANFATAAQAKADDFGVYFGSNGFNIQINDYNGRGYNRNRDCWDRYYRAYVPCRNYNSYYSGNYYGGHYQNRRGHRNHGWNDGGRRGGNHGWNDGGRRGGNHGHRHGGHRGRH